MDEQQGGNRSGASRDDVEPLQDMVESRPGLRITQDEEHEPPAPVETHVHGRRHDTGHHHQIGLNQEEYTAEEVARLIGTSLEVVMHAVWSGDLKAERKGRDVVSIAHADVVEWLRRRGPGV
jgi:hypothetical protein